MTQTATPETKREPAKKDVDHKLDEAIEDSFSTSDPIALTAPHHHEEMGLRKPGGQSLSTLLLVGGGLLAVIALVALRR